MNKIVKYIGLDVHKNSVAIAIAEEGRQREVNFYGVINNDMNQLHKFLRKQISQGAEPRCVYEAGPCGYNIYRSLSEKGIDCVVVAPSLIPRKSGELKQIEEIQKHLLNFIERVNSHQFMCPHWRMKHCGIWSGLVKIQSMHLKGPNNN